MQIQRSKRAFTLIELLAVVAIIVVLLSILMPSLRSARESAQSTVCKSNLRSCTMALLEYGSEYNNLIPPAVRDGSLDNPPKPSAWWMWHQCLMDLKYLPLRMADRRHVTVCPSFAPRVAGTDITFAYGLWIGDPTHGKLGYRPAGYSDWWSYFYINTTLMEPDHVLLADSTRDTDGAPQYGQLDNGYGTLPPLHVKAIHMRHPNTTANAAFMDGSVRSIDIPWISRDKRFYYSLRTSEQ